MRSPLVLAVVGIIVVGHHLFDALFDLVRDVFEDVPQPFQAGDLCLSALKILGWLAKSAMAASVVGMVVTAII